MAQVIYPNDSFNTHFNIDDLVIFSRHGEDRSCIISAITNSLGYKEFHLIDLDSGKYNIAYIHEIQHVAHISFDDTEDLMSGSMSERNDTKRFVKTNIEDIDELKKSRFESATKNRHHGVLNY